MQYIDIKDSQVKFVNEQNNPERKIANILMESASKDIQITMLQQQNADIMLKLERNNIS